MKAFNEQERESLMKLIKPRRSVSSGTSVVLCQKGIADPVQCHLAKHGVYALEDVRKRT